MENMNEENRNNVFLSLRNLEKIYPNGEKAVYNFNLDIDKNEFIVIVGPSGCGKSTTLRMIAGLEDITEGDIYLENELLNYKPCSERKMAIVFQSYALYPQMNVYDNIAFPLTINKYPSPVVNAVLNSCHEVEGVLENVGFVKLIDTVYDTLKGSGKRNAKDEKLAAVFGITLDSAKLLIKLFAPYLNEEKASLMTKEAQIKSEIKAQTVELAEQEKLVLAEKNIKLNERFCEINEDGSEKIELRKFTPYEIKTRVYETADKLDLTPYLDKLPKELSGGQMQRVALGRAIIKNVPVFLMDEPLSNLDAKLRLTMRSEIVKLHNKINATTIYVTHDQTEAMTMATRIVVMSKGFVQQIGTPEDVYNHPVNVFVARFIGSPSMNLFEMEFDKEALCLKNGQLNIAVDRDFLAKHDAFYQEKVEKYEKIGADFNDASREYILKTLSVTGEFSDNKSQKKGKKNWLDLIKKWIKKEREEIDVYAFERGVCTQKLGLLKSCLEGAHKLSIGIRPERIKIEKRIQGKKYDNAIIVNPTVCELLGGEYNVHFDFCGKNMVGQIDAKEKISIKDEIAVYFSVDDIYVFDPVTGDIIK